MNENEDIFPTPPEAPVPSLRSRIYSSPYFWWILAFALMALVVMWLPSQCSVESLNVQSNEVENLDVLPFVDQDKELIQKIDGLWYKRGQDAPYEGVGVTFHPSGEKKTRTKYVEGLPIGLIEEWDVNGTTVGPRFKGEFSR